MATSSYMSILEASNAIGQLTIEETRELMVQMGVPFEEVVSSGNIQKVHLVQKWLDMDSDASWDKLVAGLRKINKNSLATEIESEHLSRTPVPSSGSPSFPAVSVTTPSEIDTPSHQETPTPASVGSPTPLPPDVPSTNETFQQKVAATDGSIEHLQGKFSDLKSDAQESLSERESRDPKFVHEFRDYLLGLPVTKKQVHIQFFNTNEREILKAETIQRLFIVVGRYCNYSNYELIFHIVKRFCPKLKGKMLKYRDSLISFEKSTMVDVYLCAISARPGGEISIAFVHLTMKLNKPPSECALYEIRELKESIEEKASVEGYAMHIETLEEGSIEVVLQVHKEVGWMVGVVFTPDFRQKHLLTDVTVREQDLMKYLVRYTGKPATNRNPCWYISTLTLGVHVQQGLLCI